LPVISPAYANEWGLATRAFMYWFGPVYMRTGRRPGRRLFGDDHTFKIGKGRILREGCDVTIIACGTQVARALEAADLLSADGVAARVVNMATIKPVDTDLIAACARETGAIVTAEDHNIHGGLGGAVAEALAATCPCPVEFVGVRDVFGASGEPEELAYAYEIAAPFIAAAARRVMKRKKS
jgi:transketolase